MADVTHEMLDSAIRRAEETIYENKEAMRREGSVADPELKEIMAFEGYIEEIERLYLYIDHDRNPAVIQKQVDACSDEVKNLLFR